MQTDIELLVEAMEAFVEAKNDAGMYPNCSSSQRNLDDTRQELVSYFERVLD